MKEVFKKIPVILLRVVGASQFLSAIYILYLREPVTYSWITAFIITLFLGWLFMFVKINPTSDKGGINE